MEEPTDNLSLAEALSLYKSVNPLVLSVFSGFDAQPEIIPEHKIRIRIKLRYSLNFMSTSQKQVFDYSF